MARLDLLITAFGPFPGVRVNPTGALACTLAARLRRSGVDAMPLVLPTSYDHGLPVLARILCRARPRAVLMLGLSARSQTVRIERFARDDASPIAPDVTGTRPQRGNARSTPWPTTAAREPAVAALRKAGIPARHSANAGRYLCNAAYALTLRATEGQGIPVLFVHIPWPRGFCGKRPVSRTARQRPDMAGLTAALAAVARQALLRPACLLRIVPL
jgi:pyroglutamyl-peptidase